MNDRVVIVGAGQAAAACIATLRALEPSRSIALIGDEKLLPYRRPPLSKACLKQDTPDESLLIRPTKWYDGVDLRLDCRVEEIDRSAGRIVLGDGEQLAYDCLLLCTGSHARRLSSDVGGALEGVHTLRSVDDARRLKADLAPGRRLLVIGGGYVGLEVAAAARSRGVAVILVETAPRVLGRVASAATADYFTALHRNRGVDIREGVAVQALLGRERVERAILSDGSEHEVDIVVVGIGGIANDEIAARAGLETSNGIVVDSSCQTSDPNILAAGDCASFFFRNRLTRLESVQNASEQGEVAAARLLGHERTYSPVPWFWSDQFDTKLQIVGIGNGHDTIVVRPGQREDAHSIWYFLGKELLAVDAINDPSSYMLGRRLLSSGINPDRNDVADPSVQLSSMLPARS